MMSDGYNISDVNQQRFLPSRKHLARQKQWERSTGCLLQSSRLGPLLSENLVARNIVPHYYDKDQCTIYVQLLFKYLLARARACKFGVKRSAYPHLLAFFTMEFV